MRPNTNKIFHGVVRHHRHLIILQEDVVLVGHGGFDNVG